MHLKCKRVLVTGAGGGLGGSMARLFAQRGAHVIVADRAQKLVDDAVAALQKQGLGASGIVMDVTDAKSVARVRDALVAEGGVDVLVNNAGVVFGGPLDEVPLQQHETTIAVNLQGVITVTHAFLPHLLSRKQAYILNVSSASAFLALPLATTYAASKWGVLGFTESLREELQLRTQTHVGVGALCPSFFSSGLFDGAKPALLTWMMTPEYVAQAAVNMVANDERVVILPWTASLLINGFGWLPRPVFSLLSHTLGVNTSMTQWKPKAKL